jgi:hypothetical protein
MDATRINLETATPLDAGQAGRGRDFTGTIAGRWAALHAAAAVVAALAGAPREEMSNVAEAFPAAVRQCPPALRELAEQGVEDLAAIMEPGLAALIAVHSSGNDASAPATALWQEFVAARDSLLALAAA